MPIRNLEALRENVKVRGGAIIQYNRLISLLVLSMNTPQFEWVPSDHSRYRTGLKHAAICLALGWWSIPGFLATPSAVAFNLMGGINVTESFVPPDGIRVRAGILAVEEKWRKRISTVAFVAWLGILIALGIREFNKP